MPLIRFALNMYANTENKNTSEDIIFFVRHAFDIWCCETSEKFLSFLQCLDKRIRSEDMTFFVERFRMRDYQPGVLVRVFEAGIKARTGFQLLDVVVERSTQGSAARIRARELGALAKRLQDEHLIDYRIKGTPSRPSTSPSGPANSTRPTPTCTYTTTFCKIYLVWRKGSRPPLRTWTLESVTYCKDFL